jgi:hypothetical protein
MDPTADSYWKLQEWVDVLYGKSRQAKRPLYPGYAGAVIRTFWTMAEPGGFDR